VAPQAPGEEEGMEGKGGRTSEMMREKKEIREGRDG